MRELRRDLSWSKSREGTLSDCPRKYYFQYYGYWGGWEADVNPRTREIYLLKHLRSRQVGTGELVHDTVEKVLRDLRDGIQPPPLETLQKRVRQHMREGFRASRERRFRRETRPSSLALFEHDYARRVSDEEWRTTAETVDRCLARFFETSTWARIRDLDPAREWLELEDLKGFDREGVRVHVKLDFAHREGADAVIVDWKTGRSQRDNRLQFGCYTIYASAAFGIAPERIRGLEVNLATGIEKEYRFTRSDLDGVEETIRRSIARMRELLRDPVLNLAEEQDFPIRPARWRCQGCNFFRICPEGETLERMVGRAPAPAHAGV